MKLPKRLRASCAASEFRYEKLTWPEINDAVDLGKVCVVPCGAWWNLLTIDKQFLPGWRQSKFPGGCAHACELETSLYLYLDGDNVRKDRIKSGVISYQSEREKFGLALRGYITPQELRSLRSAGAMTAGSSRRFCRTSPAWVLSHER